MALQAIREEDLIFNHNAMDDETNTLLTLNDYDWMTYSLATKFTTKEMGKLDVTFRYYGSLESEMLVKQDLNGQVQEITYAYPSDIFKKYIVQFLQKHIAQWDSEYAFGGEEIVIDFFNEVVECGRIVHEQIKK